MRTESLVPAEAAGRSSASAGRSSRRQFLRRAFGAPESPPTPLQEVGSSTIPAPPVWGDVELRLARRVTMGLTGADADEVSALGYQQYLNDQFHYEGIDDTVVDTAVAARYPLLSQSPAQLFNANAGTVQNQLQEAAIYRAAFSQRQLYQRMVEFWSDHFNISINKVGYLKAIDDRDVIRAHALGKFHDLLSASAHGPAMLNYLDQNQSRVGAPNQNYAREVMELHTLGVNGGYTQNDVAELSLVLTGWTTTGAGDFTFNANRHDFGTKTVLGVTIPASSRDVGAGAIQEGEQMIAMLASHPSTATFIATKLLKWLLTPEPSAAQISTIAGVFRATKGDIRLVVRAILNQSWVSQAPAKFKRPFHFVVSALRATQPSVTSLANINQTQLRNVGQQLFFWDTPDGYPDTVEYWSGNIQPRWSFANSFASTTSQTAIDTTPYLSGTADAAIDKIQNDFFAGELALSTRLALLNYLKAGTFNATRVKETIALALSTSEFQWY